jgi:hypothetical protein
MVFTVINSPPAIADPEFASGMQTIVGQLRSFSQELNAVGGVLIKAPTLITASNAAWAPDSRTSLILFEVQGAGGGGGGVANNAGSEFAVSACGGGGGYVLGADAALASYNITIGAGGAGGAGGNGGSAGGNTTVTASGLTLTAGGGAGGAHRSGSTSATAVLVATSGGGASGGIVNAAGEFGAGGGTTNSLTIGLGGGSKFGKGGRSNAISGLSVSGGGNGNNASGYGAGGGGASSYDTNTSYTGGDGTPGCVLIWEYA